MVHHGLRVPLLLLGSQDSCTTGSCSAHSAADRADRDAARSQLAASAGPVWCTSIAGTRHVNVTDDAVLYLAPPLRNLLALGSIDGARGLTVQNATLPPYSTTLCSSRHQARSWSRSGPTRRHSPCAARRDYSLSIPQGDRPTEPVPQANRLRGLVG